ncbi:ClpP/crotonase-like domain-containing protein [Pyronema domesticum]|uniref:Similar to Carnitinyl-CoA dehydratase acc. no. B1LFW9 n=1 Tax=Pyronema omphalodes (strain CBS 100304) TaxID=1076935 RepID=U4KX11_PYROM|nr:ClpP/crotonase-like domain-containing protein [Pyronema domesticum]CCX05821.1 Similar to Carnitinyl-CoA dehydratase; acc. no. B1LFW9 [Pyronema omphalodes CBS 100304]
MAPTNPTFNPPPPHVDSHILISFPTPQILLVTLNRPRSMNCISNAAHAQLVQIWSWYDSIPSLRCAIITGAREGSRRPAFCAGQDLKEWQASADQGRPTGRVGGFAGLSTRVGKKPVISAVHGICYGGGLEAAANTDLIIAHRDSSFGLPESARGVVAIAGVLPRIAVTVGLQRAGELAMTGRLLTAEDAKAWGLVNEVVEGDVVEAAVRWAQKICDQSPDSIIVSREGIRSVFSGDGVDEANRKIEEGSWVGLQEGENIKEGLKAFVEKREVRWVDSKL